MSCPLSGGRPATEDVGDRSRPGSVDLNRRHGDFGTDGARAARSQLGPVTVFPPYCHLSVAVQLPVLYVLFGDHDPVLVPVPEKPWLA